MFLWLHFILTPQLILKINFQKLKKSYDVLTYDDEGKKLHQFNHFFPTPRSNIKLEISLI